MKKFLVVTLVVMVIYLTTGCATIICGSKQNIGVTSNPSGASVVIDKEYYGTTPVIAKLKRRYNHTMQVEKLGYRPRNYLFMRGGNPWLFGNIFVGGVVGLLVDFISGASYKLSPKQVNVDFEK